MCSLDLDVTAARWGPGPAVSRRGFGSKGSPLLTCTALNLERGRTVICQGNTKGGGGQAGMQPADETVLALRDVATAVIKERWRRVYWGGEIWANTVSNTTETNSNSVQLWSSRSHPQTVTVFSLTPGYPKIKNITFSYSVVVLFIHTDCFGVSCQVSRYQPQRCLPAL